MTTKQSMMFHGLRR